MWNYTITDIKRSDLFLNVEFEITNPEIGFEIKKVISVSGTDDNTLAEIKQAIKDIVLQYKGVVNKETKAKTLIGVLTAVGE